MRAARLGDLRGLWRRSLLAWPDGRRDTTTQVRWLQGDRLFADLRRPEPLPALEHARTLDDLSIGDCAGLAAQQGFAGVLGFDGRHFEWTRRIDYQPPVPMPDAGSLEWQEDVLIEHGRDVDYIEHWHREDASPPHGGVVLRGTDGGTPAILLRVGATFMFARSREVSLPPQSTLQECVAGAVSAAQARTYVDCEISIGRVTDLALIITASTLPFQRGAKLDPSVSGDFMTTAFHRSGGGTVLREWRIVESEGDVASLRSGVFAE